MEHSRDADEGYSFPKAAHLVVPRLLARNWAKTHRREMTLSVKDQEISLQQRVPQRLHAKHLLTLTYLSIRNVEGWTEGGEDLIG